MVRLVRLRFGLYVFFMLCSLGGMAFGQATQEETINASGLPLPRFASLRTNEVNLRTGPGTRYPIEWVYKTENLPVEITAEFDVWRRIKDWEGSEGWVHKTNLWGKRAGIVTGRVRPIYRSDSIESPLIATAQPGSIGHITECTLSWCKVRFGEIEGYMQKSDFWGAYPQETFD